MSALDRIRRKPPKAAYSQLRAIAEVSKLGVRYNDIINALQLTPDPQRLLDTPYIFSRHVSYMMGTRHYSRTLYDLIRTGFLYTHEYAFLCIVASYYKRLQLILRPWRVINHHTRPPRTRKTAETLFTLRCVKDNMVGALPPEILQIIMYFVL